MEKYKCYECNKKFTELTTVFKHLRTIHTIKEKLSIIKCVHDFENYSCNSTFSTFCGLRKHMKKCCPLAIESQLHVVNVSLNYISIVFKSYSLFMCPLIHKQAESQLNDVIDNLSNRADVEVAKSHGQNLVAESNESHLHDVNVSLVYFKWSLIEVKVTFLIIIESIKITITLIFNRSLSRV